MAAVADSAGPEVHLPVPRLERLLPPARGKEGVSSRATGSGRSRKDNSRGSSFTLRLRALLSVSSGRCCPSSCSSESLRKLASPKESDIPRCSESALAPSSCALVLWLLGARLESRGSCGVLAWSL